MARASGARPVGALRLKAPVRRYQRKRPGELRHLDSVGHRVAGARRGWSEAGDTIAPSQSTRFC